MILLSAAKKPKRFRNAVIRMALPRHFVAYENAALINSYKSALPALGDYSFLVSDIYAEYMQWNNATATIQGSYTGKADCLILGNTSADYVSGTVGGYDVTAQYLKASAVRLMAHSEGGDIQTAPEQAQGLELSRLLAPGETALDLSDQKIIALDLRGKPSEGGEFFLTFTGSNPITLHKLYIGKWHQWLPAGAYTYELEGRGRGNQSDIGVVYGFKMPSIRHLSCSWDLLDDHDRREIERYINAVQNVQPHYVIAHGETEFIPPLFAVLKDQKLANAKQKNSWTWSGAKLEYTEAK